MRNKKNYSYARADLGRKYLVSGTFRGICFLLMVIIMSGCEKKGDNDQTKATPLKAGIQLIVPVNQADSVVVDPVLSVTFKAGTDTTVISSSKIELKTGNTIIPGTVKFSGTTATFTTLSDLLPESEYVATIKTPVQQNSETSETNEYSWKFKTGKHHSYNSLSVVSVVPLKNATDVPVNINPVINFNLDLTQKMQDQIVISLNNGTTPVNGTVIFSGKVATFQPSVKLSDHIMYTGKVIIGKSEYDSKSGKNFNWSFTTAGNAADVTPPVISSAVPINNATSVATGTNVSVTFSEAINPLTVTSSTFTLMQGSTPVTGAVSSNGSTAVLTPGTALAANTIYTAAITTGAKDIAGNALAANYIWKFTTAAATDVTAPAILSVVPASAATAVSTSSKVSVAFSESMDPATINAASLTLKQGSVPVTGKVTYAGSTASFAPSAVLSANTVYTGTVTTSAKDVAGNALAANYTWNFTTAAIADVTAPTVGTVVPAVNAASVAISAKATVAFSEAMDASTITSSTFTLKQGSTVVPGTVSYAGSTATFAPAAPLTGNTLYTGTITTGVKDASGNALAANYSWSFTTAAPADVTAPTVLSVLPVVNATAVAISTKPAVTFSEAMTPGSISSSTFTLKQGSTSIAGTVSYSGTTATFSPSAALAGSMVYTGTITTGAKDVAGNAIAANYTWNFTTAVPADVTAPTILSVMPSANATSVAVNSKATVTFSEAMSPVSITSSTFTLKQGSTAVAGTVTYSGTTATFTPSAGLAGNTVYTGTITTGAKDVSGNAITSTYTWTFTTVATAPAGKSFSADVVPILNICNTCHTHPWTTSTNASTFYTNLVNGGYVNAASPTTSKIYTKLNGGHPGSTVTTAQVNTILTWMTEGSKNN